MAKRISRFAVRFAFHGNHVLCVAVGKWRGCVSDLTVLCHYHLCVLVSPWTHAMCLAYPFTSYTVVVALIYSFSIFFAVRILTQLLCISRGLIIVCFIFVVPASISLHLFVLSFVC